MLFFQVVLFSDICEKGQGTAWHIWCETPAILEPVELLFLPWSTLPFLPRHPNGAYDIAAVWHSPFSICNGLLISLKAVSQASSVEKDESIGFASWQKVDCASVFCMEWYGEFLTIYAVSRRLHVLFHRQGLQKGQRSQKERVTVNNTEMNGCMQAGKKLELKPLTVMSLPKYELDWNTKEAKEKTCLIKSCLWIFKGFQYYLEEEEGLPSQVNCCLIREDKHSSLVL